MQIQRLPEEVVHQIAAGEVLERPANLVKELVENSLDAAATWVQVRVSRDVRSFKIQDNGKGIAKEDLSLALERHATSKIKGTSDLWDLNTYGFRGEALACVAAVSQMKIISRVQKKKDAYEIQSDFGKAKKVEPSSGEEGTSIFVEQLFENVPARLKFLKTESGELLQIKKVMKAFALSYPHVHFQLFSDEKMIFDFPVQKTQKQRVENIFESKQMFESFFERGSFKIRAVFSSPNEVQRSSQNIWLFVQNRWIQDRSLQAAIMAAYDSLLMHGEFPTACVWIHCDPQEVDVNVHPTKSQVKFREPSEAFKAVRDSIRYELEKAPWRKQVTTQAEEKNLTLPSFAFSATQFAQKSWQRAAENLSDTKSQDSSLTQILKTYNETKLNLPSEPIVQEPFEAQPYWSHLQVLGQCNLTYILAQSSKALILVDQHAAHERIAYERLMKNWKENKQEAQDFLFPYEVHLEEAALDKICKVKDEIERLGFKIERLSPTTLGILTAPPLVKDKVIGTTMQDLAQQILDLEDFTAFERKITDICATIACHSVIRAGQALSTEEMKALLDQMDEFPLSTFCPHGRPVFVEFSFNQLDKSFGRILG